MTMARNCIGVDVSKDWIDVHDPADGRTARIASQRRDLRRFARQAAGSLVVFEASGGYERALIDALAAAGVDHVRVNPRRAREFARASGRLAKTDRIDAAMLAEMGRALELEPDAPPDPVRARLAELVARRDALDAQIKAERQRLAQARDAFVRRDIAGLLKVLMRRRTRLEDEIAAQIRSDPELSRTERRVRTMTGLAAKSASGLIARLPELGRLDRRAIASLAGLAPHARDSGLFRGRRKIWGGRPQPRRILFIAAWIASRHDQRLRDFRTRLTQAGKPFKVAITAVARKMLTILNAMIRDHADYRKLGE